MSVSESVRSLLRSLLVGLLIGSLTMSLALPDCLPADTLASLLQADLVPISTLSERHGAVATIAQTLLGIVPDSGKYLEIWPPANRMYYFMVPAFLNLPAFMFGLGAPKPLVSLALYASSLAAGCPYCSSHTCTFALRRGVPADKLDRDVILGEAAPASYTPDERSVVAVAVALARFPCALTDAERDALRAHADADAVVLAVAMMGYLNKAMDALGLPLEVATYRETFRVMGAHWSPGKASGRLDPTRDTAVEAPATDSLATYWTLVRQGPSAARFERRALHGVPRTAADARAFLRDAYGYDFPVLSRMREGRALAAVTAMIHEGLQPSTSVVGLRTKLAVARIFAGLTQSAPIAEAIGAVSVHFALDPDWMKAVDGFARDTADPVQSVASWFPEADAGVRALLVLAHAASWSPTRIDDVVVGLCRDAAVASSALVEVVAVLAMLQMLHRISAFYGTA